MSGSSMGVQTEIPMQELDEAQEAELVKKENFRRNRQLKLALNKVRKKFLAKYDNMVLVGVGTDYLIEKKENNYDFYIKIVRLIIANQEKQTTNASITSEAQKSFPEAINKNIWSKKLTPQMKASLSSGLIPEWAKLLEKAKNLSEFKKLVISSVQLKSGSELYKPNIQICGLVMSVNGVAFPIQKNSTTKNGKKHEYVQIRVNFDPFLDALKLKKISKKRV